MTQPRTLRLADRLEKYLEIETNDQAAVELRRLHDENEALRQALAQPEQEPYGWISNEDGWFRKHEIADLSFKTEAIPLYTAPPKREWVDLTDEEISECWNNKITPIHGFAREIEAKLKEKNT